MANCRVGYQRRGTTERLLDLWLIHIHREDVVLHIIEMGAGERERDTIHTGERGDFVAGGCRPNLPDREYYRDALHPRLQFS